MRNELSRKEIAELEAWRKGSPKNEEIFREAIDPSKIRADLKALEESRISRIEKIPVVQPAIKPTTRATVRRIGFRILKVAVSVIFLFSTFMGVTIYQFVKAHKHPAGDSQDQLAAVIDFSDLLKNTSFNRGFLTGFADIDITEGTNGWLIGAVPDTTTHAKDVFYRLFTSDGNRLLLNYSDSMHIWLNSNATIKYPSWQLTDTIRIFLSGESYVHIPSGTKHIYQVKISPPVDSTTPSAFREAVADKTSRSMFMFSNGGDFYLRAYYKDAATTATLINGSLRIDSAAGKFITPVQLEPGQQARLDSGNLQIFKPEGLKESLLWKNP